MTAFEKQVGGSHYKDMPIQPAIYCELNGMGFLESCAVKYLSRWRSKGGIDDLRKAVHSIELLIEIQMKYPDKIYIDEMG